jgi:hypothetical protein
LFYKTAWPIIKGNVFNTFNAFWSLDFRSQYLVNQAYMTLRHKKRDAEEVKDFQLINLIHSINKLIAKTLTLCLTPHMHHMVWPNQSAFIKG